MTAKRLARLADEAEKPLAAYRAEELEQSGLPADEAETWGFTVRLPRNAPLPAPPRCMRTFSHPGRPKAGPEGEVPSNRHFP